MFSINLIVICFNCDIENGNTIRIDPEQFDFENGSEPFSVEVEDDTYNLFFARVNGESTEETEKQDRDDNFLENYLSINLNETEGNYFTGECQGNTHTYKSTSGCCYICLILPLFITTLLNRFASL